MKISCIYAIINQVNGFRYIGSSVNYNNRYRQHISALRRGVHHAPHLQHSFTKYGEKLFTFEIIEHCSPENLINREQFYLDTTPHLYNVNKLATPGNPTLIHSKEFRAASSQRMKGNQNGKDHYYCGHLQESDILNIFQDFINGLDRNALADKYKTHKVNITRILHRHIWKSVRLPKHILTKLPIRLKEHRRQTSGNMKLTNDMLWDILWALDIQKASRKDIASFYNVSYVLIAQIDQGKVKPLPNLKPTSATC